ncbi:MAG: hypothetical protein ACTSYF_12860, partial [Promethearchaeota archaeon]
MKEIQIRASQFIYTYGPGALIDSARYGPVLILDFKNSGLFPNNEIPPQFCLSYPGNSRITRRLTFKDRENQKEVRPSDIGLFDLPTNENLHKKSFQPIYRVRRFPNWSMCYVHNPAILYKRSFSSDGVMFACPVCTKMKRSSQQNADISWTSNKDVIRFIGICKNGHLSDLNWNWLVHRDQEENECKDIEYLEWIKRGSSFDKIYIACPKCKAKISLDDVIKKPPRCNGIYPERYSTPHDAFKALKELKNKNRKCNEVVRIVHRNASNVFRTSVLTAISLPFEANKFYDLLNFDKLMEEIIIMIEDGEEDKIDYDWIADFIKRKCRPELFDGEKAKLYSYYRNIIDQIENLPEPIKSKAINNAEISLHHFIEHRKSRQHIEEIDFREKEFEAFVKRESGVGLEPTLLIDEENEQEVSYDDVTFKVVPIPRLEVVIVQQGYYRIASS